MHFSALMATDHIKRRCQCGTTVLLWHLCIFWYACVVEATRDNDGAPSTYEMETRRMGTNGSYLPAVPTYTPSTLTTITTILRPPAVFTDEASRIFVSGTNRDREPPTAIPREHTTTRTTCDVGQVSRQQKELEKVFCESTFPYLLGTVVVSGLTLWGVLLYVSEHHAGMVICLLMASLISVALLVLATILKSRADRRRMALDEEQMAASQSAKRRRLKHYPLRGSSPPSGRVTWPLPRRSAN